MSSKLRKLKQQAYEAGKKRDWNAAMESYAEILEFDKNNPSLLNEYGDVCLKAGESAKAVRQFLSAASKYKATGLLNNAQAVYKKVLRHDPENLNANWFLAEVRASQGLMVEGEQHALKFLAAAEEVSGEIKDIFLKRCHEIFDLFPESELVLEQLTGIFRLWDLPLDSARTGLLRACQLHRQGDEATAAEAVADLLARHPELENYKEYTRWQALSGVVPVAVADADVNSIQLDSGPAAEPEAVPAEVPESSTDSSEASFADLNGEAAAESESSFADVLPAAQESPPEPATPTVETSFGDLAADLDIPEPDDSLGGSCHDPSPSVDDAAVPADDGCFSIDDELTAAGDDFGALMDELVDEAAEAVSAAQQRAETSAQDQSPGDGDALFGADNGSVNLLDEILAEEGEDILRSSETEQLSTIASEIGRNVGENQDAEPEAQYQQGLVYLELGMYDQAALALEAASRSVDLALQAREMWGIALQRAGQPEDALGVFETGLVGCALENRLALGLRYHAGCILQDLERQDEAQEYFRQVHAVDAGFADVARRLRMQEV